MRTLPQNQRGIAAAGLVILAVVVLVVGGIGFMVYNNGKKPAADITIQGPPMPEPTPPPTPTAIQDDAVTATDAAPVKTTYSKSPKALQTAILTYTKATATDCVVNDKIVDIDKKPTDQEVSYAASTAITGIGCDGSASTLFVKRTSGSWEMVEKTQLGFSCETLKTNKVPAKLLTTSGAEKASCNDGTTGLVDYVE